VASFNGPAVICIDDAWFVNYTGTMSGGRVLNWDNGGGNRTELGPNDFSFRFPTPGTYTVGLTVTLNGCESDLFTREVVVEAVPASPVVRCESTDFDRVTFAWDPIPCATEYDIRINGVPRPRQTTTTFTETGLMEDESVEIEVSAISTCACDIPAVTHTCVAKACPTRMVEIPQDRLTFCLQDTVIQLVSSITPAPSNPDPVVTWTTTSNGLNAAANTFDIQAAGVGTHTLTVTYRHDGCQWSRNLTVVVNPVPVSAFTAPAVICIEDSWDVVYTGSLEAGRTYIWNEDGAVRTSTSLINHSFRWSQPGTYTVSLQVELNGCLSNVFSQSVVVEAVPAPVEIRCADTSFDRVSFAWDPIPCATEYDILINGQARPRQTATTFTLTNLNEGDQITIEVIPVSTCACPIASSSRTCIARACPPVVINLVPSQSAICLTNDVTNVVITANVTGNTPDGRGTWSGPGIDQNGNFNPRTAGIGVHQIVYDYQDSDCSYQATTQVEVNEVPRIVWEVVNPQCFDDLTGTFLFTIEGGTPPYTLTVDGRNVSAGQASGLSIGAHTFLVSDAKGCSATQTFNITPAPQPSFTISGPAILDISEDGTHRLNLNGMAGVNIDSIVWLLNDVRVCGGVPPACTEITSRYPKGPQRYNVTIYYNNGCQVSATSSFLVTQTYVITFPSVIYPNSNAGNREFRIFTDDPTLFVRKMRIYDRWGNLVFIAENFSAQDPAVWNGRFNGQDVVQGVYVFVFEMENENEEDIIESGDVTVMW
jgi:gliding motility-associated-like protein